MIIEHFVYNVFSGLLLYSYLENNEDVLEKYLSKTEEDELANFKNIRKEKPIPFPPSSPFKIPNDSAKNSKVLASENNDPEDSILEGEQISKVMSKPEAVHMVTEEQSIISQYSMLMRMVNEPVGGRLVLPPIQNKMQPSDSWQSSKKSMASEQSILFGSKLEHDIITQDINEDDYDRDDRRPRHHRRHRRHHRRRRHRRHPRGEEDAVEDEDDDRPVHAERRRRHRGRRNRKDRRRSRSRSSDKDAGMGHRLDDLQSVVNNREQGSSEEAIPYSDHMGHSLDAMESMQFS